ncbi:MAG TPA: M23 family metallopeptidase [Candidatus Dormibacteraeota bacterium]|jgi:murein DD-endopeptidase MepM/ murein hydrolase activator NlpD|nr:M23 family metallopeptidase [Candidatus Dormibacteraeota bacterium]
MAAHLFGAGRLRRLLGCGCGAAVVTVALPVFATFSLVTGLLPSSGTGGVNQVDAAAGVIGAARPLPPGGFTVTQGFGCTSVAAEPAPPRGYTCPPDGAHPGFVHFHTGIDLAAATGVAVFAVTAGTVHVVWSSVGFGLHIVLAPLTPATPPVAYLYGHLSGVSVSEGELVSAGERIASVGSTGNSTGPHLHFEVDAGGVPVNPCATFPRGYLVPAGVAAVGCVAWAM